MGSLIRRAVVGAGAAAVVLGGVVWAAGPADAATNPACPTASSSTATSCTYASTGAEQTFTVPSGVTAVTVHAVGAPGGPGPDNIGVSFGGLGASVTATVTVSAGKTLYVEVGGAGGGTQAGGFNGGGGTGSQGGAGGGASDVRTVSCGSPCNTTDSSSLASRLVVAGGGGGDGGPANGGTAGDSTVTGPGNGGNATPGPSAGIPGGNGGYDNGTFGPGGGSATGICNGDPGSLGRGGDAPTSCDSNNLAGGGGGGYYGGGAGGDAAADWVPGAGGAGSSFWATGATGHSMSKDTTGTPTVTIAIAGPITGPHGKCLDDSGASTTNGTKIDIWACNGTGAQRWTLDSHGLLSVLGSCLADHQYGGAGTPLVLWACRGHRNEQWTHRANGEYVLSANGLCLTDPGNSRVNGTQVELSACHDYADQKWSLP